MDEDKDDEHKDILEDYLQQAIVTEQAKEAIAKNISLVLLGQELEMCKPDALMLQVLEWFARGVFENDPIMQQCNAEIHLLQQRANEINRFSNKRRRDKERDIEDCEREIKRAEDFKLTKYFQCKQRLLADTVITSARFDALVKAYTDVKEDFEKLTLAHFGVSDSVESIESCKKLNQSLRSDLQESQAHVHSLRICSTELQRKLEHSQRQVQEMQTILHQSQQEIEQSKKDLAKVTHDAWIAERAASQKIENVSERNKDMCQELESVKQLKLETDASCRSMHAQIADLNKQVQNLQKTVLEQRAPILKELEEQNQKLKKHFKDKKCLQCDEKQKELNELKNTSCSECVANNTKACVQCAVKQSQLDELKAALDQAIEARITSAKKLKDSKSKYSGELENLTSQLKDVKITLNSQLKNEKKKLSKQLQETDLVWTTIPKKTRLIVVFFAPRFKGT
jgi:hypothetical protein